MRHCPLRPASAPHHQVSVGIIDQFLHGSLSKLRLRQPAS